jgi:hypothetical protein
LRLIEHIEKIEGYAGHQVGTLSTGAAACGLLASQGGTSAGRLVRGPDGLHQLEGFAVVLVDARPCALDPGVLRVGHPEAQAVDPGDHGRLARLTMAA